MLENLRYFVYTKESHTEVSGLLKENYMSSSRSVEYNLPIELKEGTVIMGLLKQWRDVAYSQQADKAKLQKFWAEYFVIEKGIYEQLLADKDTVVSGTVKELADKYETELQMCVGFLDGINDSLKEANPIEEMDENTQVSLDIDFEKLYYNMVGCRAEWLYNLKEWDDILTEERRKELYKESRNSTTVVKGKKIGRNDPCPCGSGKKYKKCCGKNA